MPTLPSDLQHQQQVDAIGRANEIDNALVDLKEQKLEEEAAQAEHEELLIRDSHAALDANQYGIGENLTELKNAVVGGLRDSVSSVATAPERLYDMASGAMQKEIEETGQYKLDWDPLGNDLNPITKTWWGNLIRGGVHLGTFAIPVVGGAKLVGTGAGVLSKVSKATVLSSNALVRGASIGAVTDTFSEYSQGPNALRAVRDRWAWFDTPLTVNDHDHPLLKTFKNVVEGIGIGGIIDSTWMRVSKYRAQAGLKGKPDRTAAQVFNKKISNLTNKAEDSAKELVDQNLRRATADKLWKRNKTDFNLLTPAEQLNEMLKVQKADRSGRFTTWTPPGELDADRAARKISQRVESIDNQTVEHGIEQLKKPGFGGAKNNEIAGTHQGNPNSTGSPYDVAKSLKRMETELGSELGSTDNLVTAAAAERIAKNGSGVKGITPEIAKELLGDARFNRLMSQLEAKGQTLEDAYGDAYLRMQEVVGGRNAGDLSPDDFWQPIRQYTDNLGGWQAWSVDNILAADLVNQSLFKQLRDRALASRELLDIVNIDDIDGPIKHIRDNLIVGIEQVNRSKFLISPEYFELRNQTGGKAAVEGALSDIHSSAQRQVDMMLDIARNSGSDDLLHALIEAFSMSNQIRNWTDFDTYMKGKLFGMTTLNGKKQTGVIIRELQGVMVNSILSGPKTPIRAIMGTGSAVFTRPISLIMGGAMRYGTSGFTDASMLRSGLANLNAMVQAVPEATEYFFTRLNSYWAGDISTIKSRFAEYTKSDEHWSLLEYWSETRGTDGEKAAFRVANVARNANNTNLLNYSTKLMAATDDAFTMILARARAREKAMLSAFDDVGSPVYPHATKEVMKAFETKFYDEIFNPETGAVNDSMLAYARGEATLTKDISGFAKSLDELFQQYPMMRPFYLFARTGVNGLELSMKHAPGFNFFVKEFNDIAFAKPDNLADVAKYGIETAEDLMAAKTLQNGRLMLGSSVIFTVGQAYANGLLTGNGPVDPQLKRVWQTAGWVPRSIKLGGAWVSYESFEPFSNLIAAVADLGDNQRLMGEEWHETGMLTYAFLISKGMVSKTYLSGLQDLMSLFSRDPKKHERIAAGLVNNMMPLAGLRNEIGKFLNPHMKEIDSSFSEQIRNRNLVFEYTAGSDSLATKFDVLDGSPIRDWSWPVRLYNAVSPVTLNIDEDSPGRNFLRTSNYDLSTATTTGPNGEDLRGNSELRSKFQYVLGRQGILRKLDKLAKDPAALKSLRIMEANLRRGDTKIPPSAYDHNKMISKIFKQAKAAAWSELQNDPAFQMLIRANQLEKSARYNVVRQPALSRQQSDAAQRLLELTNK